MAGPMLSTTNGGGFATTIIQSGTAVDSVLAFRPPLSVDAYAQDALKDTADWLKAKWPKEYNDYIAKNNPQGSGNNPSGASQNIPTVKDLLPKKIPIEKIDVLSKRLDTNGLEDLPRYLLSHPDIYAYTLWQAVDAVSPDDISGLANAVLLRINDEPKRCLLAYMLTKVTNDLKVKITLSDYDKNWPRLVELTLQNGVDIRDGQVRSSVMDLLGTVYREGNIPHYLEQFIKSDRNAVPASSFTPPIRQAIVNYLMKLGVLLNAPDTKALFDRGIYDEYFLLAYNEAQKLSAVTEDPIDSARIKGGEVTWNFQVDSFDAVDRQGVIPSNILAAGALDYIYTIGELMRVFDVANALILRWASGMLDIPEGKTAAALYRFHKLRNERNTPAERAMLYKRVLNKGNGKLLSRMVVNQAFPSLWHQLMAEITEYIRKSERSKDVWVSRSPLYQATKNLQYNLTEHMTGMSHVQVTEDYAHLQEALDILRSDEIINNFGGRRKSLWSVIEQVAKEDLGVMVPTSTLRTIAVDGNKIFQWLANFQSEGGVRDTEFSTLLSAGESWIIAQASMQTGSNGKGLPHQAGRRESRPAHRLPQHAPIAAQKPKQPADKNDFDDWDV